MTSVREDNSVAFKGTKQHWMSPQSKTLFTLKEKNKLMTWLKSGRKLDVTSCSSEIKTIRAFMSRHAKQGLGFMPRPGAHTLCGTISCLSQCSTALSCALSHPTPPCSTPTSQGKRAGRREMSTLQQASLFLLLDNLHPTCFPFPLLLFLSHLEVLCSLFHG